MTNPLRILREYKAASALNDALEDGADHPALYQQETFWTRVVTAAVALVNLLPLPKGSNVSQWFHKFAMVAGIIATIAPQVQAVQQVLPMPANVTSIIGLIVALAAAIQHNPIGSAPAAPAGPQSIGAK